MKSKSTIQGILFSCLLFFYSTSYTQSLFLATATNTHADQLASNAYSDYPIFDFKTLLQAPVINHEHDGYIGEDPTIAHYLPFSGTCYPGTGNRFTGSWHSNLYIGNNNGANVLLGWGQNMLLYTTGAGTDITVPTTISAANYTGIPLEVKSCSSGGGSGLSVMVLRTSTNLYVFGTAANITAITTMASFGGTAITTANSNITAKLPAGVLVTDISQVDISRKAFAIVTKTGHVYVLTTLVNLQGDKTAANTAVWHHVTLTDGVTPLTGVTKFSLSGSGAFALVEATNKIYYWGAPANVAGVTNTATSYNYAFDMSAQIPATKIVKNLVCLGTSAPTSSTLFLLCNDSKVYGCGVNTDGCLGINNATVTFNQATFITVKGTDGTTDLANIIKIDGDTEGDVFCMGAMSLTGQVYGWGNSPAGMLGVNANTAGFAVPRTVQLFISPAPATGFSDFSVAGHFILAFYVHVPTDQYWYLGHNISGSFGDPANTTAFILAAAPANLNAPGGISFDCSNPYLPISWLDFNAQKQANAVLLNWSTATELNSLEFVVQHSMDGTSWLNIGIKEAAGNSNSTENYSFIHTNPAKGINYYRLQQRDIDNNNSYSKTVSVMFNTKTKQLIISPNSIVNGIVNIQLQEANTIQIYNSTGQLVLSQKLAAGQQVLHVSQLIKGVYLLQAGSETEKFIIR